MPAATVTLTVHARHVDDMCTVCWKSGLITYHTTELRNTGVVVGGEHTYCALCYREAKG